MPKAVSPLLAGVLLIAVTVGVATLTTGFISTTFQSTQAAVSNKTTDAASCANAEIVIDDAYVKSGDNGTVAVPVRNSGFTDLQLASAQLYDKLGNNFSASNISTTGFNRGNILNLNFQLAKFANSTADSSGMNNNGNCTKMGTGDANNTCSFTLSGKSGSAISFDGVNDYVDAGSGSSLDIADAITVEAWVKENSHLSFAGIAERGWNALPSWVLMIVNGQPYFGVKDSSDAQYAISTITDLSTGVWHHIAGVYSNSGNYIQIFVDGHKTEESTTLGSVNPLQKVIIGQGNNALALPFNGTIDEVAIWNRSLSGEEINSTMNSGVTSINTTGLVGYWKFDEGRGVLSCPTDFSQIIVSTNCGGISAAFSSTPKCS